VALARVASVVGLAFCLALVLWVRLVPTRPDVFAADAREHAAAWTFTGDDGHAHVYLGDLDSYLWLRHARTLLRTGDPCDALVDGACRDEHTGAPLGAISPYARTLHVRAIAAVHALVTAWRGDGVPLSESSLLATLVVALAGVLPAFFLGRRLGGNVVGGTFGVVLTALDARVLARTLGSDNDVWTVVLPLWVLWLVVGALGATRPRARVAYSVAAGVVVGLHAWAWSGWPFVVVVVGIALAGVLMLEMLSRGVVGARGERASHRMPAVRDMAVVLLTFGVAAGVATSLTPDGGVVQVAREVVASPGTPVASPAPAASGELRWPSGLDAVAELAPLDLAAIASMAGGSAVLVAAWLGWVLLLLPQGAWQRHHRFVLLGALLCGGWLVTNGIGELAPAIALLGVPLVAAALAGLDGRHDDGGPSDAAHDHVARVAGVLLIVWFVAAAYAARNGLRFYLLAVPPIGIGCGVLTGRATSAVRAAVADGPRWYRAIATTGLVIVLAIAFVRALEPGFAMASRYRPLINDAWWDALTALRERSAPDAIVHTWWERGHWVTYVAERRVANDGSSLQTHIPYWTARALLAPDDAESAGVLRMLSCGSDALPRPEGERGASAILRRAGKDPLEALAIVDALVARDDAAAAAYLDAQDLAPAQRDAVLRATHCAPPEGYLVLSSEMLAKRTAIVAMASWDPRAPAGSPATGTSLQDETTGGVPFVRRWSDCAPAASGDLVCAVESTIGGGTTRVESVTYPADAPERAVVTTRPAGGGPSVTGSPARVLVAGADRIESVAPDAPAHADLGVLIDVPGRRVLVGAPDLVGSTLVQLLYLDGRTTRSFAKVDERSAAGERVTTWRVRWPSADDH